MPNDFTYFHRPRRISRGGVILPVAIALGILAPGTMRAQSYFAPLVTPPRSAGSCAPTRAVHEPRPGATPFTGHRLVITGVRPGERRQITVFIDAQNTMLYDDLVLSMSGPVSGASTDVLARIDSLGHIGGQRTIGSSAFPESVRTMRHDPAALQRMREQVTSVSSHTALTAAEQARVREMAAWLLKRCP